jgi:dynein heavy chain
MLSFLMCIGILQQQGRVAADEFSFFLKGGIVMDRSEQRVNPCESWLTPTAWDQITELDKLSAFKGIGASFEQYARDWCTWWSSAGPENNPLPGDWDSKLGEMQKCLVLRCLRMDRIVFAMTKFVANSIGVQYIKPPEFDLADVFSRSKPAIPLLFILSPGVDPTRQVSQFGATKGLTMETCSLGQGQDVVATAYINSALTNGSWVFLANCHLMTKWLPTLSKMIDERIAGGRPHQNFRLWLSSNPTRQFPIDILRGAIKMTTEPPQGLRANMLRLYNLLDTNEFEGSVAPAILSKYKKLLFSLCWFHSVLLERRKFKSLGLNVPYDFNDSDFQICKDILKLYLGQYTESTPWEALRYLTAQANYGGRVTDFLDRRLVNTYIEQFYCEEAVTVPAFKLSSLDTYEIPPDGSLDSYKLYIRDMASGSDDPGAFGQHANADISYLQDDGKELLITILSIQDATESAGGQTLEELVLTQAMAMGETAPLPWDFEAVVKTINARGDPAPLRSVLLQEVDRYNQLLVKMHHTISDLQLGIKGLVVITSELEEVMRSIGNGLVPTVWGFGFPSLKPLGPWLTDVGNRVAFMNKWMNGALPAVFWLPAFTYPTGFTTALLQTSARKNGLAIDSLDWDFPVFDEVDAHEKIAASGEGPTEGAYMSGMFLEGACWDRKNHCLGDPSPMELTSPMPIVHFLPKETSRRKKKDMYACPLYLYPLRTGSRERPSYMLSLDLSTGERSSNYFIKRGCALLLSLST